MTLADTVNGFSHGEAFFIVQRFGKASRPHSAPKKRRTAALVPVFYPARSRSRAEALPNPRSRRNSAPPVRNRTQSPKRLCDSPEFGGPFANLQQERSARCPRFPTGSRASFRPHQAVPTNKRSLAKATTAQQTGASRTIANRLPVRATAQIDPLGVFRFVWPESCVPIPQDRKYRQRKSDPNRRARFDRLKQSRKRNRKNQKEKIRPACLPNRQQVSRDKKSKNKDWCGTTAGGPTSRSRTPNQMRNGATRSKYPPQRNQIGFAGQTRASSPMVRAQFSKSSPE